MKSKLQMILFVLILGSVLTTALVAVDNYTKGPIAKNKEKKLQRSILACLRIAYTNDSLDNTFSESIETKEYKQIKFYRAKITNEIAFEINGMGLWGPIFATVALSPDMERIQGLSIIHQEETPGLGGRIAEEEFLNRFNGKNITKGLIILAPGKAKTDNEVDGITGATLSCKAFEAILNNEIKRYVAIIKESE